MRLATVSLSGRAFVAAATADGLVDLSKADPALPRGMTEMLSAGEVVRSSIRAILDRPHVSALVDPREVEWLPVVPKPGKIICVGLNYRDHSSESGFQQPDYPTLFARFASSLVGHGVPIVRPRVSVQLDYEGEIAAVIGRGGRHIPRSSALGHVAGYTLFNDASVRDFQTKAPQWTVGKNFDGTGAFGPELVTADELPPGAAGLRLTTRHNGETVQSASTRDMVFAVDELIAIISEAITLETGDVIVSGTPAGVGLARKPPRWMKPGDTVEVEVEGLGVLRNPIVQEPGAAEAEAA